MVLGRWHNIVHWKTIMASPAFRHAFSNFPNITDIAGSLKTVVVKIIEIDIAKHVEWENTDFMKGLKAEGIHISFLSNPCVITSFAKNETGRHHIMQSEIKHIFTEQFWPRVLEEPIVAGIIISHLRSMSRIHAINTVSWHAGSYHEVHACMNSIHHDWSLFQIDSI